MKVTSQTKDGQNVVKVMIELGMVNDWQMAELDKSGLQAGAGEIATFFSRLMLHRRKAGVSEITMPAFMEDLVSDIETVEPTVLELAIASRTLRQHGKNEWFPETSEIIQHIIEIRQAFSSAVKNWKLQKDGERKKSRSGHEVF